jgi:hypothetical protein
LSARGRAHGEEYLIMAATESKTSSTVDDIDPEILSVSTSLQSGLLSVDCFKVAHSMLMSLV